MLAYAEEQKLPWVRAETLVDADVDAVRLDSKCQYNALGTERLARELAPPLRAAARP